MEKTKKHPPDAKMVQDFIPVSKATVGNEKTSCSLAAFQKPDLVLKPPRL
jgi:hypothetical protein